MCDDYTGSNDQSDAVAERDVPSTNTIKSDLDMEDLEPNERFDDVFPDPAAIPLQDKFNKLSRNQRSRVSNNAVKLKTIVEEDSYENDLMFLSVENNNNNMKDEVALFPLVYQVVFRLSFANAPYNRRGYWGSPFETFDFSTAQCCFYEMQDALTARRKLQKLQLALTLRGHTIWTGDTSQLSAWTHIYSGNCLKALRCTRRALELHHTEGNWSGFFVDLQLLALAHLELGDSRSLLESISKLPCEKSIVRELRKSAKQAHSKQYEEIAFTLSSFGLQLLAGHLGAAQGYLQTLSQLLQRTQNDLNGSDAEQTTYPQIARLDRLIGQLVQPRRKCLEERTEWKALIIILLNTCLPTCDSSNFLLSLVKEVLSTHTPEDSLTLAKIFYQQHLFTAAKTHGMKVFQQLSLSNDEDKYATAGHIVIHALAHNEGVREMKIFYASTWSASNRYPDMRKLCCLSIASISLNHNHLIDAKKYLIMAFNIHNRQPCSTRTLLEGGEFYRCARGFLDLGQAALAVSFLTKASRLYFECQDRHGEAKCQRMLSLLYLERNWLKMAKSSSLRSLHLYDMSPDCLGKAHAGLLYAETLILFNELTYAEDVLQKTAKLFCDNSDFLGAGDCYQMIGDIHLRFYDYELSQQFLEEAIELHRLNLQLRRTREELDFLHLGRDFFLLGQALMEQDKLNDAEDATDCALVAHLGRKNIDEYDLDLSLLRKIKLRRMQLNDSKAKLSNTDSEKEDRSDDVIHIEVQSFIQETLVFIPLVVGSLLPFHYTTTTRPYPLYIKRAEQVFQQSSSYKDIIEARRSGLDKDWERVFRQLGSEWGKCLGAHIGISSIGAAVNTISADSLFPVDAHSYAKDMNAINGVCSAVGLIWSGYFMLKYNAANVSLSKERAKDLFGGYFFFAISARIPAVLVTICLVLNLLFWILAGLQVARIWTMCILIGIFIMVAFEDLVLAIDCIPRAAGRLVTKFANWTRELWTNIGPSSTP